MMKPLLVKTFDSSKSLLLKRKAVSGVTLLVSDFALTEDTKLPTITTNK
jgi:hypothetical protein